MSEKQKINKLITEFLKEAKLPPVLVILGPTASGKTALSLDLAQQYRGEIISADSRQVYRGIDISAAKISKAEMRGIPHHLIDIRDPNETLTTQVWKELAENKIRELQAERKLPIVCGGTTLYISALVQNFDFGQTPPDPALRTELESQPTAELAQKLAELSPADALKINPKNKRHLVRAIEVALSRKPKSTREPQFEFLQIGLNWPREVLYERINRRAEEQFARGLVAETQNIIKEYSPTLPALSSFGYSEILEYLENKISLEEALQKNQQRNRNYAKRQITWWKKDPTIHWFEGDLL